MKRNARSNPYDRKQQILEAAVEIATDLGYQNLTRGYIVAYTKLTPPTISRYWNFNELKDLVMKIAIKKQILPILASGIFLKNELALMAPTELKLKAQKYLEKTLLDQQ